MLILLWLISLIIFLFLSNNIFLTSKSSNVFFKTTDLAVLINKDAKYQTTTEFLETINSNLKKELN